MCWNGEAALGRADPGELYVTERPAHAPPCTRRDLPGRYPGANYPRHRGSQVRAATGDGLLSRPSLLVLHAGEAPEAAAKFQGTSIQVRRWTSWHRFTTLALAALAILAICAAGTSPADEPGQPDMIELTVNEIRSLINVLRPQPPTPGTSQTSPLRPTSRPRIPAMITKEGCRTSGPQ